jgi:hypothetical protein
MPAVPLQGLTVRNVTLVNNMARPMHILRLEMPWELKDCLQVSVIHQTQSF